MMAKQYRVVNEETPVSESNNWTPFLKQLHVSSGVWTLSFVHGLGTGAPTVFIPQIRKDWNSTIVDDELASWFYSTSNFSALVWIFVLPAVSHYIGRKIPYLMSSIAITIFFALLYFSTAPYQILIAQGIQGFVNASSIAVVILMIPEYCNHRYRSCYLIIQYTTFYWGMWVSNAIGTFFDWKYIAILGFFCSFYLFTISFYPESPRWLASKGKFAECEASHRWIRGTSQVEENELQDLIHSQENYPKDNYNLTCSGLVETLTCKQFYMPLMLLILTGAQYNFSGKFVCSIYVLDILKKITNQDTAYKGMLILDGVTVFGMYIGSVLPKFFKVRPLFLKLSFISISVMFLFSLYLYLIKLSVFEENNALSLGFLVVYSLAMSSGPITLCVPIYSEIICVKYQAISYAISSFIFLVTCSGILKFCPLLFKEFGIHGSFLFFSITSGIATILLYIYLPDTKNKTLVEIEQYFKDTERFPETEILTQQEESDNRILKSNTHNNL